MRRAASAAQPWRRPACGSALARSASSSTPDFATAASQDRRSHLAVGDDDPLRQHPKRRAQDRLRQQIGPLHRSGQRPSAAGRPSSASPAPRHHLRQRRLRRGRRSKTERPVRPAQWEAPPAAYPQSSPAAAAPPARPATGSPRPAPVQPSPLARAAGRCRRRRWLRCGGCGCGHHRSGSWQNRR